MAIDIIIITYNAKDKLKACLESIAKNTRGIDYIITIVDNASVDGTPDFLANYAIMRKSINVLHSDVNLGFSGGANLALKNTHNRFICLLDDDVEVSENWLSGMLRQMKNKPDIGIVGCKIIAPDGIIWSAEFRIKRHQLVGHGETGNGQRNYIKECDALIGPCWLMRRELLNKVGYFDERFFPSQSEDIDYCLRTRLAGYKIIYNGEVKVIHHHLFRDKGRFEKNRIKFLKKWKPILRKFPFKDSHPADKHIYNGIDLLEKKKFRESLAEFEKAEAIDKRFSEPVYKGLAYEGMRKHGEALREFKKAIRLNPGNTSAHYNLATLYKKTGFLKEARIESGKIVDILCDIKKENIA